MIDTALNRKVCPGHSPGQQGFSLLEVLVAFAILSLSLGVLFQIFSSGVRGTVVSERYNQALIIAESRLARVGVEAPIEAGLSEGDAETPYHWRVTVTPYQEEGAPLQRNRQVQPFRVEVSVGWEMDGVGREIKLDTLRLAATSSQ